jgi:plastocyanin
MILTRRRVIEGGGTLLAALLSGSFPTNADGAVVIAMKGRADGSHVWFDPVGIHIRPGQTVRWINRDAANSHTSTAYHPDLFGLPRRIPSGAPTWHSAYLLPEESFSVQFHLEGVYVYYCVPHAQAGMVGRIVVGEPHLDDWMGLEGVNEGISKEAIRTFPEVEEIMRKGFVTHV